MGDREDEEDEGDGINGKFPSSEAPLSSVSAPIYPIKRVRKGLKVSERVIFSTLWTLYDEKQISC